MKKIKKYLFLTCFGLILILSCEKWNQAKITVSVFDGYDSTVISDMAVKVVLDKWGGDEVYSSITDENGIAKITVDDYDSDTRYSLVVNSGQTYPAQIDTSFWSEGFVYATKSAWIEHEDFQNGKSVYVTRIPIPNAIDDNE